MSDHEKWVLERLDRILELLERQVQLQEELMYQAEEPPDESKLDSRSPADVLVLGFGNPGRVTEERANLAGYLMSVLNDENYRDLSARLMKDEYVFPMITNQHWMN